MRLLLLFILLILTPLTYVFFAQDALPDIGEPEFEAKSGDTKQR